MWGVFGTDLKKKKKNIYIYIYKDIFDMISFEVFGYRSIVICYWEIIINLVKCCKNIEIMFFKKILSYDIYGEIWLK